MWAEHLPLLLRQQVRYPESQSDQGTKYGHLQEGELL